MLDFRPYRTVFALHGARVEPFIDRKSGASSRDLSPYERDGEYLFMDLAASGRRSGLLNLLGAIKLPLARFSS